MVQKQYKVVCTSCGDIDGENAPFSQSNANRVAGQHEGATGHECSVTVVTETPEFRCPVCHTLCVGKQERDEHAESEPGVDPSSFVRV